MSFLNTGNPVRIRPEHFTCAGYNVCISEDINLPIPLQDPSQKFRTNFRPDRRTRPRFGFSDAQFLQSEEIMFVS
jgi:hypothetical protein